MDQLIAGFESKTNEELQMEIKKTEKIIEVLIEDEDDEGLAEQRDLLEKMKSFLADRQNGGTTKRNKEEVLKAIEESKAKIKEFEDAKRKKKTEEEKIVLEALEKELASFSRSINQEEKLMNDIEESKRKIKELEEYKRSKKANEEKVILEDLERQLAILRKPKKGQAREENKEEPEAHQKADLEKLNKEIENGFKDPLLQQNEIESKQQLIDEIKTCTEKKTKPKLQEKCQNLLNWILLREEIQAKAEEKLVIARNMEKISNDPSCKDFYNISCNFMQDMEKLKITSILQFRKRKEFEKTEKDLFTTLGQSLKSLESLLKTIQVNLPVALNDLENQLKVFHNHADLSDQNKDAILYIEQLVRFQKFSEIDERLLNLESDILLWPNGTIEKRLMSLIYQLKLTLLSDSVVLEEKLEEIKKQISLESLETYDIKETLTLAERNLHGKMFPNMVANLEDICKKLNPININEIDRLFSKTDDSARKIRGRKVLLFLGGTGAGKSTTICYLSGCKMKKIAAGHIEIDPDSQTKIECKISSATKSETRYINPIYLPLNTIIKGCDGELILCDAPGFLDTEGPEIDMANGLGIIKAVKGCLAVKPVIFFSQNNVGARYENVQSLLSTLVGIISNVGFQVKNFEFIFTHYTEEERGKILKQFGSLRDDKKNSKNQHDQILFTILDEIVKRGDKLKIINPLDGNPGVILQEWLENPNYINNCDENFKFDITIESKTKVMEHCSLMKASILNQVRKLRNFEVANFKLNQLKLLHSIVGISEIKQTIEQCVDEICDSLNGSYNEACELLDRFLIPGNVLRKEHLEKYNESIELISRAAELKRNHLGDKLKGVEYFASNLERGVDKLMLQVKEKGAKDSKVLEAIGKIFEISRFFSENEVIQAKTKDIRMEMEKRISEAFEKFTQALENIMSDSDGSKARENLEVCVNVLAYIQNLAENLEIYFQGISEKETLFREQLKSFFKSLSETPMPDGAFEDPKVAIEVKIKTLKIFEVARNFIALDRIISHSQLKEYQDNILLNIQDHCKNIFEEIKNDFGEKATDITNLEQRYTNLSLYKEKLRDPRYKSYIEETVRDANQYLMQTMQEIQNNVSQAVNEMSEGKSKMSSRNVLKLHRGLKYLHKADWVKKHIPNFALQIQSGLSTTVSDYLGMQRDEFLQFDLRVFNHDKLQEAVIFLENISVFKDTNKILGEETSTLFKEMEAHFKESVDKVYNMKVDYTKDLDLINDIFNYFSQFRDVFKIQTALRRLRMSEYVTKAEEKLDELKVGLLNEFESMDKRFKDSLSALLRDDLSPKDVNEHCSFVVECLPKFQKISKLNQISKLPNKSYKETLQSYDKFYFEFDESLKHCMDNSILLTKLNICNSLSKLDDEVTKQTSFQGLYTTYKDKFFKSKTENVETAISNLIPNHDFETLKTEVLDGLSTVDLNNQSIVQTLDDKKKKIKQALTLEIQKIRENIDKVIEELTKKMQENTYSKIKEILRYMKKFELAEKHVKGYIVFRDESETFQFYVDKCRETFEIVVNRLKSVIEHGFIQYKFEQSEKIIVEIFENLRFDRYYDAAKLHTIKENFDNKREESLNKLLEELNGITFDEWNYDSIIDYYPCLVSISDNSNFSHEVQTVYSSKRKLFFDRLKLKIEQKLKDIQCSGHRYDREMKAMLEIKSKFPRQLQSFFEAKKQGAEDEKKLIQIIQDSNSKIEEYSKRNDFSKLFDLYSQHRTIPEIPKMIEETVTDSISRIVGNITDSFQQQKCNELLYESKVVDSFKKSCENFTNDSIKAKWINTLQTDIQKSYREGFQKPLDSLPKYFNYELADQEIDGSGVNQSVIQTAKFVTEVLQKSNDIKCVPTIESDISQTFEQIKKVLDRDQQVFDEYGRTFKQKDAMTVKKLLNKREKCDKLIRQLINEDTIQVFKQSKVPAFQAFVVFVPTVKLTKQDLVETLVCKMVEKEEVFRSLDFQEKERKDASSRLKDYEQIQNDLEILGDFKLFEKYDPKFSTAKTDAVQTFKNKLEYHYDQIDNNFLKPKNKNYSEDDCISINKKIENLKMVSDKFPVFQKTCKENVNNITTTLTNKFLQKKEEAMNTNNVDSIVDALVQLQAVNYVEDIKKPEWVDEILANYKKTAEEKKLNGTQELNKIGILLQAHPGGKMLVSENKMFKGLNLSLFNEKLQKHGIDEVLKHIEGDELDKNLLKKRYEEGFKPIYEGLIEKYLKPKFIDLQGLKNELKLLLEKVNSTGVISSFKKWFQDSKKIELPNIIAHLFAIWTLMNADDFFEMSEDGTAESKAKFLLQPHAAQVLSIFRMMSCGDSKEEIKNNLVQIGTGEGKSVTLAMTSTVLALLGYSVDCACYSPYLSARDFEDFKKFFSFLDVLDYIMYGSFNVLCEKNINSEINVRSAVLEFCGQKVNNDFSGKNKEVRENILLIDEVDVFFSKDFYGALYSPSAVLKDNTINELLKFIWEGRSTMSYAKAVQSQVFLACVGRFPKAQELLKEALKDIVAAAKAEIPANYEVLQDQIGYKEQDSISFNISYGYTTTFTYFLEFERKNISQKSLEDHLGILIKTGSFSFAEVPKTSYAYMMGVTGTLKTLGDVQRKILKESYGITKNTYMPSVFGKNNRKFKKKDDLHIEEEADYFEKIRKEIERTVDNRAVLLFFEDEDRLMKFYNSENFKLLRDKAAILTERASAKEKKDFVSVATLKNKISLMVRCFGRGTDFKCRDDAVIKAGGIHVIQTFLSLDRSEEVQVQGRCARQGDDGSYSMVLLKSDLEAFLIKDIPENDKYDFLDMMRNKYFNDDNLKNEHLIKEADVEHQKSREFLKDLIKKEENKIKAHLLTLNRGVEMETKVLSRTLCLMDATGSMGNLLDCGKKTISQVFQRAKDVLADEGANPDCFEFQVAFYRNYGSGKDKILEASNWVKKPDDLKTFMEKKKISGGQGNEAIEIGLWHANRQYDAEPFTQIMIIGDAAPNTESDIKTKREGYSEGIIMGAKGENFWKNTQYHTPTFFRKELQELKGKKVKIYSYYVYNSSNLQTAYKELASTEKACQFLDVNNAAKGADELLDTLAKVILNDIGGEKFEAKYEQKFKGKRGYT